MHTLVTYIGANKRDVEMAIGTKTNLQRTILYLTVRIRYCLRLIIEN